MAKATKIKEKAPPSEAQKRYLEMRAQLEAAPVQKPGTGVRSSNEFGAKRSPELEELFLGWLRKGYTPKTAAANVGVSRTSVFMWRKDDPDFARRWAEAVDEGTDVMEDEARRRAVEGYDEPVFQGGECVGFYRRFSDNLLIMMLKGRRPETYRDRYEVTGRDGGPLQQINANMTLKEAQEAYAATINAPNLLTQVNDSSSDDAKVKPDTKTGK